MGADEFARSRGRGSISISFKIAFQIWFYDPCSGICWWFSSFFSSNRRIQKADTGAYSAAYTLAVIKKVPIQIVQDETERLEKWLKQHRQLSWTYKVYLDVGARMMTTREWSDWQAWLQARHTHICWRDWWGIWDWSAKKAVTLFWEDRAFTADAPPCFGIFGRIGTIVSYQWDQERVEISSWRRDLKNRPSRCFFCNIGKYMRRYRHIYKYLSCLFRSLYSVTQDEAVSSAPATPVAPSHEDHHDEVVQILEVLWSHDTLEPIAQHIQNTPKKSSWWLARLGFVFQYAGVTTVSFGILMLATNFSAYSSSLYDDYVSGEIRTSTIFTFWSTAQLTDPNSRRRQVEHQGATHEVITKKAEEIKENPRVEE